MSIRSIKETLKRGKVVYAVYRYIKSLISGKIPHFKQYKSAVLNRGVILEIGGLSDAFEKWGVLPLYQFIPRLDICNYCTDTGRLTNYTVKNLPKRHKKMVNTFIYDDGTDLKSIENAVYDAVMTSHTLEHIANPIKSLMEQRRILKSGGYLIAILPNKDYCFDHRRPYTSLQHLINDYQSNVTENDQTHVDEVITLHDLHQDNSSFQQLKKRLHEIGDTRSIHHHIYNENTIYGMFEYASFTVLDVYVKKVNIFVLARKEGD